MKKTIAALLFCCSLASSAVAQSGPGPGPGPGPVDPWVLNGSQVSYDQGCVTVPSTFAGGCQGAGTLAATQFFGGSSAFFGSPLTGTIGRFGQVAGTTARMELDSFGATSPGVYSIVYGRGTGAAPTAVQSGDEIGSFNT